MYPFPVGLHGAESDIGEDDFRHRNGRVSHRSSVCVMTRPIRPSAWIGKTGYDKGLQVAHYHGETRMQRASSRAAPHPQFRHP